MQDIAVSGGSHWPSPQDAAGGGGDCKVSAGADVVIKEDAIVTATGPCLLVAGRSIQRSMPTRPAAPQNPKMDVHDQDDSLPAALCRARFRSSDAIRGTFWDRLRDL